MGYYNHKTSSFEHHMLHILLLNIIFKAACATHHVLLLEPQISLIRFFIAQIKRKVKKLSVWETLASVAVCMFLHCDRFLVTVNRKYFCAQSGSGPSDGLWDD